MPIIKNLSKLQKKKADSKLHPRGRKFKQLTTAEHRQTKLESLKANRNDARDVKLERYKFFQAICQKLDQDTYSVDQVRTMCQEFIDRNKPELEQLEQKRRKGQPPTSKHLHIKNVIEQESHEFDSGFNVVDLSDATTVANLKAWGGNWGGLNMLKMTRVARN